MSANAADSASIAATDNAPSPNEEISILGLVPENWAPSEVPTSSCASQRSHSGLRISAKPNAWAAALSINGPAMCDAGKRTALPAMVPAAAISAIGAIVGEWVGAHEGLGPVMIAANAGFQTAVVFAAIFYLAIMAIALFLLVGLVERLVMPWHFLTRDKAP